MVRSVSASGREEAVFNLILGIEAIFVANGYLVRSKPPAPAAAGRTEGGPLTVPAPDGRF